MPRSCSLPFLALLLPTLLLSGCGRKEPAATSPVATPAAVPVTEQGKPFEGLSPWFEDITARSGVRFIHQGGTNYAMPDQIGGGGALLDYDNDGRLDLFFVQSGAAPASPNQLYHQESNGTFRDVTAGSGLDVVGRGMGACAGDLNNDGLVDLVVTEYGAVRCFQNLGHGRFREVTGPGRLDNPRWAAPVSLIDYDRDGWLDVVVGNYVDYDPTRPCYDVQGRQDFCGPRHFGSTAARLWRNATGRAGADLRFEDRTEASGLSRASGAALGLLCGDFDGDGWPDLFFADDERPNRLFVNQRDGTFREEAVQRGLAFTAMGAPAANMGVAFADINGDGWGDLFVTHLTEEFHALFVQGPRGIFSDRVASAGLQQQGWRGTGWGTVLADFNSDGLIDLGIVNGLVRRVRPGQVPVAPGVDPWWGRYAQRPQLFQGIAPGRFRDVSESQPELCGTALNGRGLMVGDLDNDGALDLVVLGIAGPARLLRNIAAPRGHWLRVRVIDPALGGRDAIGAELIVQVAGKPRWSLVQPSSSYLVSNDPVQHFGLGAETVAGGIEVLWPDGARERFPGGAVDRLLVLRKGAGSASPR